MPHPSPHHDRPDSGIHERRSFFRTAATWSMAGGLAAGYGTFAAMAGRFLYPSSASNAIWQFVGRADELLKGGSWNYSAPDGSKVVITRRGSEGNAESFVAFSSICPHLGCQVHWEAAHERFFCPCHNGAFDASGRATAGPPQKSGQQLVQFPLRVEGGLLYIQVPAVGLATASGQES